MSTEDCTFYFNNNSLEINITDKPTGANYGQFVNTYEMTGWNSSYEDSKPQMDKSQLSKHQTPYFYFGEISYAQIFEIGCSGNIL